MRFRCSCEVVGLASYLKEKEELKFRFDRPKLIVVRLSTNYPAELKPLDPSSVVCIGTTTERAPDTKARSELKAALSSSGGRWINLKEISPSTLAFLDGAIIELQRVMASTISLLRWREGLAESPPGPCLNRKTFVSQDGRAWREDSGVRGFEIHFGLPTGPMTPANVLCRQVVELVKAGIEEPLGRQLFREAWNQRASHPRSALVIGVAAAEVGFKKLVGNLVPQAQWLVDEIQTPSLSIMLRKYLPTLPVRARFQGKPIRPPGKLLNKLDEAVKRRNDLVHAGQPPPKRKELDEMLRAVNDLLWICDVYSGQVWASSHISGSTTSVWEDEKPKDEKPRDYGAKKSAK